MRVWACRLAKILIMRVQRFEDLMIWQKAQELAISIYKQTETLGDFGYRDQVRRAAVSISNNIAEGFERSSKKEFARYLIIAKGSSNEVRSMIYIGKQLNYFDEPASTDSLKLTSEINKMIWSLINYLNNK